MTRYIDYFRKGYKMDWFYDKHVEWQRNWKKQTIVKKLQTVGDFIKQSIGVLLRLCVFFKCFFIIKLGKKAKISLVCKKRK